MYGMSGPSLLIESTNSMILSLIQQQVALFKSIDYRQVFGDENDTILKLNKYELMGFVDDITKLDWGATS